ncbi:MAG: HD domain-containing protein [Kiritimatiellales bacterium]|nr:HD domain-containing protein [Kiritimatiellales bacterium]
MPPRIDLRRLTKSLPKSDKDKIQETISFGRKHLAHLNRRSKEDYLAHGIELALVLREATQDISLFKVAILHDIPLLEDGEQLLKLAPLTRYERGLVKHLNILRRLHIDEKTKDLDAFLEAFHHDERLLILRMAHRMNDVRNLKNFVPDLRKSIARETLYMYAAIAGRLGMQKWRHEMEDICFVEVHPKIAKAIETKFSTYAEEDQMCLDHAQSFIKNNLAKEGIYCEIENRRKALFSTYHKMMLKKRTFENLTDRLAIRVVVNDNIDCYRALGVVHSIMHPMPGKLKDYIGAPKENGYRSIHTVVFPLPGVTQYPIEIQIRTSAMHKECEFGALAHGEYKNKNYALDSSLSRVSLIKNLESLRAESQTPQQFGQVLRKYFREDHIAIFDHQNNLFHLKKPATALDFVCSTNPKRCSRLKEIRVNGRKRELGIPLHDGDVLEPRFGRGTTVERKWVESCEHKATKDILIEMTGSGVK